MDKPLLVFDGDCGFCRRWVERWRASTKGRVDYRPYQTEAARHPELPLERFQASVQWFGVDGLRAQGAEAVFRLLAQVPGRRGWLWCYRRLPGFSALSEAAYRFVASRRALFSRLDRWLWGSSTQPAEYRAGFWLMLRLLGLVNAAAFASLWGQAAGLWGPRGILPAAPWLAAVRGALGERAYALLPSLFWLSASSLALEAACGLGVALGLLAALGLAVGPALLGSWALYLSFLSIGREFLSYQWDMLLVEATFLAVLSAPWRWKPELSRWKPPASGVWLTRLLLFRLVFESGCVKLMSGDPSWRSLSALVYHYQTQPLPTWPAWYAHLLPLWAQKLSCALMFAVELGAPWLIWLPRRARLLGGALIAGLMALIAATGNYCFFNALTVLLCLSLVDDQTLGSWASRLIPPPEAEAAPRRWARPLFALLALMALLQVSGFSGALRPPRALEELLSPLAPLRLVNGYGLFAVMTTERLEIEIEGSRDGRRWRPYRFKWKPDDPARRPRFVEPFQPRLDWQMWFAALGSCRENPWFVSLLVRLLQGSPPVLSLLGENPFPKRPPRYVRSTLYRYRFTEPGQSGWWLRRKLGPYCPTLSLSPGAPGFDRMAR